VLRPEETALRSGLEEPTRSWPWPMPRSRERNGGSWQLEGSGSPTIQLSRPGPLVGLNASTEYSSL